MPDDLSLVKPPFKAPMLVPRMRSSITTTSAWFLTTKNLTAETGPPGYWGCWMTFKIEECRLMASGSRCISMWAGPEIGRASCREREWTMEVAGVLKKKRDG